MSEHQHCRALVCKNRACVGQKLGVAIAPSPPSFSLPPGCRGGKKMWVCVSVEEPDLKTVC